MKLSLPARLLIAVPFSLASAGAGQSASPAFAAYNETSSTDFRAVYLAPQNTQHWGPNQALNDKDGSLDTSERLTLKGLEPGRYDVKLMDKRGRTCLMKGVDLTRERSFEIRDADLKGCR